MALQVLTQPKSDGIEIAGARIFFTIPMPIQELPITESQINSWLVILSVFWLCLYLTHGITAKPDSRRQHAAEWIVEKTEKLVHDNMGAYFRGFAPFIAAVMALSAFSSLLTLIGLYPPTSDLNVVAGWAILVFVLITYYKMKCGPDPLSEELWRTRRVFGASQRDQRGRHAGLHGVSSLWEHPVRFGDLGAGSHQACRGFRPFCSAGSRAFWGRSPFLQIGLPAVLSIYFDVFSGCLQAFIFAMLTMLYISSGFPAGGL